MQDRIDRQHLEILEAAKGKREFHRIDDLPNEFAHLMRPGSRFYDHEIKDITRQWRLVEHAFSRFEAKMGPHRGSLGLTRVLQAYLRPEERRMTEMASSSFEMIKVQDPEVEELLHNLQKHLREWFHALRNSGKRDSIAPVIMIDILENELLKSDKFYDVYNLMWRTKITLIFLENTYTADPYAKELYDALNYMFVVCKALVLNTYKGRTADLYVQLFEKLSPEEARMWIHLAWECVKNRRMRSDLKDAVTQAIYVGKDILQAMLTSDESSDGEDQPLYPTFRGSTWMWFSPNSLPSFEESEKSKKFLSEGEHMALMEGQGGALQEPASRDLDVQEIAGEGILRTSGDFERVSGSFQRSYVQEDTLSLGRPSDRGSSSDRSELEGSPARPSQVD